MTFICYPKCTTCIKARKFLTDAGIEFAERDIKADAPTAEELRAWHAQSGLPLSKFFNTSGMLYRSLGLAARLPSMNDEQKYELLASDGMLVKRPILVFDGKVLLGFSEKIWREVLK